MTHCFSSLSSFWPLCWRAEAFLPDRSGWKFSLDNSQSVVGSMVAVHGSPLLSRRSTGRRSRSWAWLSKQNFFQTAKAPRFEWKCSLAECQKKKFSLALCWDSLFLQHFNKIASGSPTNQKPIITEHRTDIYYLERQLRKKNVTRRSRSLATNCKK